MASFHHHLHPQEGITLSFLHMSPKSVHRYHCPHHLSKDSCVEKIPWRRDRLPTPLFLGFPGGSAGKESACNVGDQGLIPGLERSPIEGKGYPLQFFWPGEFHGLYSPWGHKGSDTTFLMSYNLCNHDIHLLSSISEDRYLRFSILIRRADPLGNH